MTRRAFILDLDGTLIDSLEDLRSALSRALIEHEMCAASRDDVMRWIGNGVSELCRQAILHQRGEATDAMIDTIRRSMLIAYDACCIDQTRPYDGINEAMAALIRDGRRCAVLSNKSDNFTRRIVEALFPSEWFTVVRGARDDAPRKPAPDVALWIAGRLGVAPGDCFFVGDSEVDIQTARNAGMISVAVTWGFREPEALRALDPDHVIEHPSALCALAEMA